MMMKLKSTSYAIGMLAIVGMFTGLVSTTEAASEGYWRFEEVSGDAIDAISTNDGTLGTGVARSTTVFGSPVPQTSAVNTQSMAFDETAGGVVNMGTGPEVNADDFTLELWAYVSQGANGAPILAGKAVSGAFLDRGFEMLAFTGGSSLNIQWAISGDAGGYDAVVSTDLAYDTWYHFAGVREGTALRLYVDGVLNVSGTTDNTSLTSSQSFAVGGSASATGRELDGFIDEVRLSDGALAPSQFLNSVPEPASIALMVLGLSMFAGARRKPQG